MGKLTLFNNSGVQIPNSMADLNQQLQGIQDQINGHFEGTVTPGGGGGGGGGGPFAEFQKSSNLGYTKLAIIIRI